MTNLQHQVMVPNQDIQHLVRRILITTGDVKTNEKLPIAPTGFGYLTYARYPFYAHYSYTKYWADQNLYLVNQLENELPFFELKGKVFQVGLELYPQVPYYLFNLEGNQLVDSFKTLLEIDSDVAKKLIVSLGDLNDLEKVVQLLQHYLLEKSRDIKPNESIEKALAIIYQTAGNIGIDELAKKVDKSARQLRRIFDAQIGLSPKQYCKVIQFNAAFEAIQFGQEKELYGLALKYGYYDHAHFINDFKAILGQSPTAFLKSDHSFLKQYLGAKT